MSDKSVIKLLKTGNFTLIGQDSDNIEIYEGHIRYDDIEKGDLSPVEYEDYGGEGYVSALTLLLAKALGGKTDSI